MGETEVMEVIWKHDDELYDVIYSAKPDSFNTEIETANRIIDSVQIWHSSAATIDNPSNQAGLQNQTIVEGGSGITNNTTAPEGGNFSSPLQ